MPAPRINPTLMSASMRAQLARIQSDLALAPKSGHDRQPPPNGYDKTFAPSKKKGHRKQTLTPEMVDGLVKSVKVSDDRNEVVIVLSVNPDSIPTAQGKGMFVDKKGHVHVFTKQKQRDAEEAFHDALAPYAHITRAWGEVPIGLEFKLLFPYPTSTPKKHRHKIGPHITRPDGDNCIKNEVDAMTRAGFWTDDSFINDYHIYKRRTTGPACIKITITNLQPKFEALYSATDEYDNPSLFSCDAGEIPPAETNPLSHILNSSSKTRGKELPRFISTVKRLGRSSEISLRREPRHDKTLSIKEPYLGMQ